MKLSKMWVLLLGIALLALLILTYCNLGGEKGGLDRFPELTGSYFGQSHPGKDPKLFAPGLVSAGMSERDFALSPDGKEIYYSIMLSNMNTIMVSRFVDGRWTEPQVASFARNPNYFCMEPCVSSDNKRIFFLSNRAPQGQEDRPGWGHQNIWAADRLADGSWGEMYELGRPINSDDFEYYPSMAQNGTLYFTRQYKKTRKSEILFSRLVDGRFETPQALPAEINGGGRVYNAWIEPQERFLLACVGGREDSYSPGRPNYYVFFHNGDGEWSNAINLGDKVNMPGQAASAISLSPDGEFLFFANNKVKNREDKIPKMNMLALKKLYNMPQNGNLDIYWMRADWILDLKP